MWVEEKIVKDESWRFLGPFFTKGFDKDDGLKSKCRSYVEINNMGVGESLSSQRRALNVLLAISIYIYIYIYII